MLYDISISFKYKLYTHSIFSITYDKYSQKSSLEDKSIIQDLAIQCNFLANVKIRS